MSGGLEFLDVMEQSDHESRAGPEYLVQLFDAVIESPDLRHSSLMYLKLFGPSARDIQTHVGAKKVLIFAQIFGINRGRGIYQAVADFINNYEYE